MAAGFLHFNNVKVSTCACQFDFASFLKISDLNYQHSRRKALKEVDDPPTSRPNLEKSLKPSSLTGFSGCWAPEQFQIQTTAGKTAQFTTRDESKTTGSDRK